jgi:hypothetical protein
MAREYLKTQIADLRLSEPALTYREIAARLGCAYGTVSGTCSTLGLTTGSATNGRNFSEILRLGYAARRAGLTKQQIEAMKQ